MQAVPWYQGLAVRISWCRDFPSLGTQSKYKLEITSGQGGTTDLFYGCFYSHLPYFDIVQLHHQALLHQVHHLVLPDPLLPQSQAFVRHPGWLAGLTVGLLQLGFDLNM